MKQQNIKTYKINKTILITLYSLITMVITSNIVHAQEVRLTSMNDVNFGMWSGTGDLINDDPTCVYRDNNNRYKVTATDNSTITPNDFFLENSTNTVELPYVVKWNNSTATGGSSLQYNTIKNRKNANTSHKKCAIGGNSANMNITIKSADLDAVPAGVYSATITIMAEPR